MVIPVYDEAASVGPLAGELRRVLDARPEPYEVIFVDDASRDGTAEACLALEDVRVLRHPRNRGQSAATLTGIEHARGELVVTLDGDGQNDPASIPRLLDALPSADVAVGVREDRRDPLSRRAASRVAYGVRQLVLGDGIVDVGCSLRAFPRREALALPRFDGLHRVLPALFVLRGLRVAQVPTAHRPRVAGVSKYGALSRGRRGLLDLAGLYWLRQRMLPAALSEEVMELSASSEPPGGVRSARPRGGDPRR